MKKTYLVLVKDYSMCNNGKGKKKKILEKKKGEMRWMHCAYSKRMRGATGDTLGCSSKSAQASTVVHTYVVYVRSARRICRLDCALLFANERSSKRSGIRGGGRGGG